MARDIQHLKPEPIRARYELSQKYDREQTWSTSADLLSDLDMPHYDNLAYQEYRRIYYDGGDRMAFKDYMGSMVKLAKGQNDGRY